MGVKFGREYEVIVADLTAVLKDVERWYEFLEVDAESWEEVAEEDQAECLKTMADDLFYALGTEKSVRVGESVVTYDKHNHVIKISVHDSVVHVVYLV